MRLAFPDRPDPTGSAVCGRRMVPAQHESQQHFRIGDPLMLLFSSSHRPITNHGCMSIAVGHAVERSPLSSMLYESYPAVGRSANLEDAMTRVAEFARCRLVTATSGICVSILRRPFALPPARMARGGGQPFLAGGFTRRQELPDEPPLAPFLPISASDLLKLDADDPAPWSGPTRPIRRPGTSTAGCTAALPQARWCCICIPPCHRARRPRRSGDQTDRSEHRTVLQSGGL